MRVLQRGLAAIGRRGTEGFALSIVLGLALPQFASAARPLLPVTIFCFMVIVFLRADFGIIAGLVKRPAKLLGGVAWTLIVPPLLILAFAALVGRQNLDPGMMLGLAVMGAAPPIMSSPAVAILYRFEPSLIIAVVLVSTVVSPLLSPLLADLIAGGSVPIDRMVLTFRLLVFVGGGMVVAVVLRRWLGRQRVADLKAEFDGFGVLMYFVFAVAAMDGVTAAALERPALVGSFLAVATGFAVLGLLMGYLLLRFAAPSERFMLGYGTAQRNMGLLIAALGAGVPPTTFLFFALAQFPIYLMPWLLKPVAARIRTREEAIPAVAGPPAG